MWKFFCIALTALLVGCTSSNPVSVDYDTSADFSAYRRYAWLEARSGADKAFNPLLADRVKGAIGDRLTSRQFESVSDAASADFLVRYYLKTDDKVEESKARGGVSMGSFGGNVGMGVSLNFPLGGTTVKQRAMLLIDFINNQNQKMTWRGSRSFVIEGENPDEVNQQIRAIVDQILAEFPPK